MVARDPDVFVRIDQNRAVETRGDLPECRTSYRRHCCGEGTISSVIMTDLRVVVPPPAPHAPVRLDRGHVAIPRAHALHGVDLHFARHVHIVPVPKAQLAIIVSPVRVEFARCRQNHGESKADGNTRHTLHLRNEHIERYCLSIFIFNKKSMTFALGLGALDKNTIFLALFFK